MWFRSLFAVALIIHSRTRGFQPLSKLILRDDLSSRLFQSKSGESDKKSGGYKFGDISRFLTKRATEKVNELTGKDAYEFGDLSRWLDSRAKERVQATKGDNKVTYIYEFGDFTRWADALAKEKAAQYAGKEKAQDYQFGDLTKTIISKVRSGEYNIQDVYLALRVLLTAGFSILPIASLLPMQGLIALINMGLAKDIGFRMMEVLAVTLDARLKEALTGNSSYQLGDMTKDRLRQSLSKFTGKEMYEFGDLTSAIMKRINTTDSGRMPNQSTAFIIDLESGSLAQDLKEWDARFQNEGNTNATAQLATLELAKWDAKLQEQGAKNGATPKT